MEKTKQSRGRLEAMSDAIFAFAATLLVVSLDVPENFEELKNSLASFFSFAISFFGLIMIWKIHYNFFRRTEIVDNWIVALNMGLLFVVLYFVYPLKFLTSLIFKGSSIASYTELSELFQLYGLGFALVFLFISLLYFYASKKKFTIKNRTEMRYYFRHFGIFFLVGILSVIVAKTKIGIQFGLPGFIYPLLGPLCWWHGVKFVAKEKKE